jgi:hypothetical protein
MSRNLSLLFPSNWYATPVAAASVVRDAVEDDYLSAETVKFLQGRSYDIPREENVVDEVAAASAVRDNVEDDYLLVEDDVDDEVTGEDDEQLEEPVAVVMIVAPPLRRSKRVAAQRCKALRSGVAPSPYATSGLRRSARLAGLPRVNYKY